MHAKAWAFEGLFASLVALLLTYYVLEPKAVPLRYGGLLGWSATVVILILVIQGFWKTKAYRQSPPKLGDGAVAAYESSVNRWGGVHTALSIVVIVLAAVHGALFFPGLIELSLAVWLGALSFLVLIILNLSGVLTESRRRSRDFGPLKRQHVLLMLTTLVLAMFHVEGLISAPFLRQLITGAIVGLVGAFVVFITVPLTVRTHD